MMQRMDEKNEREHANTVPQAAKEPTFRGSSGHALPESGHLWGNHGVLRRLASSMRARFIVGQRGDIYEQEADRVAARLLAMPEPLEQQPLEGEGVLASPPAQAALGPGTGGDKEAASQLRAACGPGVPLAANVRAFFEPRLGYRLSDVRIYAGPPAGAIAEALRAQALTVGGDIVFGSGRFAPETGPGRQLLAHELAHVLQQQGSAQPAGAEQALHHSLSHIQAPALQKKDYNGERYDPTLGMCGLTLSFDGASLAMKGKKSYTYRAVSGQPSGTGTFDYSPARQKLAGIGPIPEGTYWTNPAELWTRSRLKFWMARAWGNFRITLHPFSTTETFKRGGFFIHGGAVPGSAGCIDLTADMDQFVNDLRSELGGTPSCQIHLSVRYPRAGP